MAIFRLDTTMDLRQILVETRTYFNEEIQIKKDLLMFLNEKPEENKEEIEHELDQLQYLYYQKSRFEYLAGVVVVQPEKEGINPFLLLPADISTPPHVEPVNRKDLDFIHKYYKFCFEHMRAHCQCFNQMIDR